MTKTSLARWISSDAYDVAWSTRSDALLGIFRNTLSGTDSMTFAEYGCGPNAPFSKAVGHPERCQRYDIKAWDDGCRIINLNENSFLPATADVAVLSGVLEYMNDPKSTLLRLGAFHRYILLSYHPIRTFQIFRASRIDEINKRAGQNGWRNHLTLGELFDTVAPCAFPLAVRTMKKQVLMLSECFDT